MRFGPQPNRFGPVERGRYELVITAPDKKTIEQPWKSTVWNCTVYRKLRPQDGAPASVLTKSQPFYRHWAFFTAVGGGAVLGGTIAAISMSNRDSSSSSSGTSTPNGDVLITLP